MAGAVDYNAEQGVLQHRRRRHSCSVASVHLLLRTHEFPNPSHHCYPFLIHVSTRTGAGTLAFCSGGDQEVRGKGGYVGADGIPRLNVLDLQVGASQVANP